MTVDSVAAQGCFDMIRLPLLAVSLLPTTAMAHVEVCPASLYSGLVHPLDGLDHVLAIVAVGLWAVQTGSRALWSLPLTFAGSLLAACLLVMCGVAVPPVEPIIFASIIVLGAAAGLALQMPQPVALALVAVFGAAHGATHAIDAPHQSPGLFLLGLGATTLALTGAGVFGGRALMARRAGGAFKALGALTAGAGLVLASI
jgi:urease accessory protein